MEALKQIAPDLKRVTTIFNPKTAPYYPLYLSAIGKAASTLAVELTAIEVHDDAEIEGAMNTLAHEPDSGLIVMPDSFNMAHRQTIIAFADRHHLPAIYYFPLFATDGGLISYGPDEIDMFRRTAGYVDRILKGAKVGDLPVQQPTSFRLVDQPQDRQNNRNTDTSLTACPRRRGNRISRSMSAFGRHCILLCTRLLMTQSGHSMRVYCANSGHGTMVDLTVFIAIASATARPIPSSENGYSVCRSNQGYSLRVR